jgi:hypothetical protein
MPSKLLLSKTPLLLLCVLCASVVQTHAAEKPNIPLIVSADWFRGLGAWTAKDAIQRGFESGGRRHGPVKLRRLAFSGADIRFDFRIKGQATFASFPINGSRILTHTEPKATSDCKSTAVPPEPEAW